MANPGSVFIPLSNRCIAAFVPVDNASLRARKLG